MDLVKICLGIIAIVAAFSYQIFLKLSKNLPKPDIDINEYWGPGDVKNYEEDKSIKPFKIDYSEETIERLKRQLDDAGPFTEPLEDSAFEYGFNSKRLHEILNYWKNDYIPKWTQRQEFLNQFRHFKTQIQGLNIHFIHVKPKVAKDTKVYTVLMLHGWPGSIREFYEIIPLLTNPSKDNIAFEVIIPSLPGYGFSQGSSKKGLSTVKIAVVMRNLMLRVGIEKFYIQGGDWGSIISGHLSCLFPENVLGFHSNFLGVRTPLSGIRTTLAAFWPSWYFEDQTKYSWMFPFKKEFMFLVQETGYFHLQATKPDTIGIALNNNPSGLAAYILEKFSTATNRNYRQLADGGFEKDFSLDALLDNIMIYYLSNSITTSVRLYKEGLGGLDGHMNRVEVTVPTAVAHFRNEITHQFEFILKERFTNIIHISYHEHGGHFAALQLPKVLHQDFVEFVKKTL